MPPSIRLLAEILEDSRTVRFFAAFPAPAADDLPTCQPAKLITGDPQAGQERAVIAELPALCSPSAASWQEELRHELAVHTFPSAGPHKATLRWGDRMTTVTIDLGRVDTQRAPALPVLSLFEVKPLPGELAAMTIRIQVNGLASNHKLRIDAGGGQVFNVDGQADPDQTVEWTAHYSKPGAYSIAVALVDRADFWLATLARHRVEALAPPEQFEAEPEPPAPGVVVEPLPEVPELAADAPPWLPFRYIRPLWAGATTFTAPGGNKVSRRLALGTYLAVKAEALVDRGLWYQSTHGDWIPAYAVAQVTPSALRGVELRGSAPPPPPPGTVRYGIVTASLLNVRARPGVAADNPPVAQLNNGARVTIYEETLLAGDTWYRIGDQRWVIGRWIRLVDEPSQAPLRGAIVIAPELNVRARPGTDASNPVIDQLPQGSDVIIYEETALAGATWCRIGDQRWVHSDRVRMMGTEALERSDAVEGATLPVGWVVASTLSVRRRPGTSSNNPVVGQLLHNQRVDILETRTVSGARWYRIGTDQWVLGQWVAAASSKARPSSIGAGERWVGVNLSQQTAVAYEGDGPVYAAMVATGAAKFPTVQGVYRTWLRLKSGKMSGGNVATGDYYYLEEVTWTCYFYAGYALHAAYWHDAFGRPRSHGCVNMSPYDAWWIYQWSAPGGEKSPAVTVYWS